MRVGKRSVGLLLAAGTALGMAVLPMSAAGAHGSQHGHSSPALDTLARDVARVESLREVEDVQRSFAQLAQYGRWDQMGALFARNGTLQWGDEKVTGQPAVAAWLKDDAGAMDGRNPGSLDTMLIEDPIANLSVDGRTAKVRWSGMRFMGDGQGNTRIDGGIYENGYVQEHGRWKIANLHYYPQFEGDYENAWTNVNGEPLPIVPYHFDADLAGVPIPPPSGPAPHTRLSAAQLAARIARLNDEDSVRNLQDAYGYYVDERMWDDVVDLLADDASVKIAGVGTFHGKDGVRQALEQTMGPAGLTQSTLNQHPIFDTIVDVQPGGRTAVARGTELGMLEDPTTKAASWQFLVFRNTFVQDNGLWKLKELNTTPLITANYAEGWGNGGVNPTEHPTPAFLDISRQAAADKVDRLARRGHSHEYDLADLTRRLARSQAYDGAVNVNDVYTTFLDDNNCAEMGRIHAQNGHKESPAAGFYVGPARIDEACAVVYGDNPPTVRSGISYHWEPQPVILVSHDGRSANIRARLFQPRTSTTNSGFFSAGLDGAMYNDQAVLENGIWRVWDTTIDEPYWSMANWKEGWAGVPPRDPDAPPPPPRSLITDYPPDLLLTDMGEREDKLWGGTGHYTVWPDIVPMWFNYRNLVSGRVPEHYQADCTPCGVKPSWSMVHFGYELPPNGPSIDGVDVPAVPH